MRRVQGADDPPGRQHLGAHDPLLLGVGRACVLGVVEIGVGGPCVGRASVGAFCCVFGGRMRLCRFVCELDGFYTCMTRQEGTPTDAVCLSRTRVGPGGNDDGTVLLLQHAPVAHDVHVARGHGEDALCLFFFCEC